MIKRWKTKRTDYVFKCRWFEVSKNKVELPDKKIIDYFKIETPPSVMIVPVTDDNKIVMVRQYRYPVDDFFYELPCGRSDGKSMLFTAIAELEEEAGYRAEKFKELGYFVPWNGVGTEKCYVYLATGLKKTKQKLDEAEFIEVELISIKNVYKMVENNEIRDGMAIAALGLARRYLEN